MSFVRKKNFAEVETRVCVCRVEYSSTAHEQTQQNRINVTISRLMSRCVCHSQAITDFLNPRY